MKDICIEFIDETTWNKRPDNLLTIRRYKEWIRQNINPEKYYFSKTSHVRVFFLDPEDVTWFTLVHGRVFRYVGEYIEMTKIEKMILHAAIVEGCENDN